MTTGIPELTEEFKFGLKQLDMLVPERPESSGLVLANETPQFILRFFVFWGFLALNQS